MHRKATTTGPGTLASPSAHRRTVRASIINWRAASSCDHPSPAIAARNSSADTAHDPGGVYCHAALHKQAAQSIECIADPEGVGQPAVRIEQSQPIGAVLTAGNEADGIGGQGGAGGGLAHAPALGRFALPVNLHPSEIAGL